MKSQGADQLQPDAVAEGLPDALRELRAGRGGQDRLGGLPDAVVDRHGAHGKLRDDAVDRHVVLIVHPDQGVVEDIGGDSHAQLGGR